MDHPRASGLLLHLTSLPGPYGVGDLGPEAYRFADFLARTGQRIWQVLPLVPVGLGNSPYSSPSTFAGIPLLISPDRLRAEGLLGDEDLAAAPRFAADAVDFGRVIPFKYGLLRRAFDRFEAGASGVEPVDFEAFCVENADWLEDYALFMALKQAFGDAVWTDWPGGLAARAPEALAEARREHAHAVRMQKFWQYLFAAQWDALKTYCHARDIRILGDLPIYVAHDSADVWAHPDLFYLDDAGRPTVVAGVPPDYFSATGQRWGNPIYRWDVMRDRGYAWWTRRMQTTLRQVDIVRLDHFRAFAGYWEIPASEETAVHGRWVEGPGASLFARLREALGELPVVAENLGIITPDVTALMEQFGFPGMAVLQFAFGGDPGHGFLPHNYAPNLVAYTGTHDNDTVVGWWRERKYAQDPEDAARIEAFVGRYLDLDPDRERTVHWAFIRALLGSVARIVVTPLQDVLGLDNAARMNTPGNPDGNWTWRFTWDMVPEETAEQLRTLTHIYGR